MKKYICFLFIFILIISFTGCKNADKNTINKKSIVAVSIVPEATFVNKVCGDKFDVVTMIPSGASPETYEPTPKEFSKLANAKLYFSIGVPSEEGILPLVDDDTVIIELHKKSAEVYPEIYEHNARDPHIWLSPKRVKVIIESIAEAFEKIDPENSYFYKTNAQNYISELDTLDNYINSSFEKKISRKFIVFHPSFSYFANDYSLSMFSLEEHGKEITAKRLTEISKLAKNEDIKTIFYQAEASAKQSLSFAEEINGSAVMLNPLSDDYINNLKNITDLIAEAIK